MFSPTAKSSTALNDQPLLPGLGTFCLAGLSVEAAKAGCRSAPMKQLEAIVRSEDAARQALKQARAFAEQDQVPTAVALLTACTQQVGKWQPNVSDRIASQIADFICDPEIAGCSEQRLDLAVELARRAPEAVARKVDELMASADFHSAVRPFTAFYRAFPKLPARVQAVYQARLIAWGTHEGAGGYFYDLACRALLEKKGARLTIDEMVDVMKKYRIQLSSGWIEIELARQLVKDPAAASATVAELLHSDCPKPCISKLTEIVTDGAARAKADRARDREQAPLFISGNESQEERLARTFSDVLVNEIFTKGPSAYYAFQLLGKCYPEIACDLNPVKKPTQSVYILPFDDPRFERMLRPHFTRLVRDCFKETVGAEVPVSELLARIGLKHNSSQKVLSLLTSSNLFVKTHGRSRRLTEYGMERYRGMAQ